LFFSLFVLNPTLKHTMSSSKAGLQYPATKNGVGEIEGFITGLRGGVVLGATPPSSDGKVLTWDETTKTALWQDPPATGGAASSLNYNNTAGQIDVNSASSDPIADECLVATGTNTAEWKICPLADVSTITRGFRGSADVVSDRVLLVDNTTPDANGKVLTITNAFSNPKRADWVTLPAAGPVTFAQLPIGGDNYVLAGNGALADPAYKTVFSVLASSSAVNAQGNTYIGESISNPTIILNSGGTLNHRTITSLPGTSISPSGQQCLLGHVQFSSVAAGTHTLTLPDAASIVNGLTALGVSSYVGMSFDTYVYAGPNATTLSINTTAVTGLTVFGLFSFASGVPFGAVVHLHFIQTSSAPNLWNCLIK